ncbi:MAG: ATP-binding protein [Nitrospirota bacterium]
MSLLIFIVENKQRRLISQQVKDHGVAIARSIAAMSITYLVTYNYVALQQNAEKAIKEKGISSVIIHDKEGRVAAYSRHGERQGEELTDTVSLNALRVTDVLIQRTFYTETSERIFDIAVPVYIEGSSERWGVVRVGISLEEMYKEIFRTRLTLIAFGIVAIMVGSLGAVILSKRITRPIHELAKGMVFFSQGNLQHRVELKTGDEIGELAENFNRMAEEILSNQEKMRHAERLAAVGIMAAGIAHEIKNPLTAIKTFVQLLPSRYMSDDFRTRFNTTVPREIDRVTRIIQDLLDLSRKPKLQLLRIDVNLLITQTLDIFYTEMDKRGIALQTKLEEGIPLILGDTEYIKRAFSNFIINAIHAMPQGGTLSINTRSGLESVIVTFEDSGAGMSPEILKNIFDPFFTTKEKGIGLGMVITKKIVEEHDGDIGVWSEVGRGSVFQIKFPVNF